MTPQSTTFDRDAAIKAHKQKKLVKEQYSKKNWGLDLSLDDLALISATFPSAQQYRRWVAETAKSKTKKSTLNKNGAFART